MWLLKFWGDPIIGEFLLGIGLAALFIKGYRLTPPVAAGFLVAGLALAVVFYQTAAYEHVWRLVTGGLPAILIAAAVVLGPSAGTGRLARLLAVCGDASYALYLTHPFTIKIFGSIGAKLGLPIVAIFWLGLIATVAAAVAVHFAVEKPIGAWLSRATAPLDQRRPAAAEGGS